jgi:3-oxoacyl-[acyl-carrier protein] reductase
MNLDLRGKRAVVSGSTQGIGKASAMELALLGATVTLLARNEESLKSTVKELPTPTAQQHDYLVADFSNPAQLKEVIDKFVRNNIVHILINNTGGPPAGLAVDAAPEDFIKAFTWKNHQYHFNLCENSIERFGGIQLHSRCSR